MLWFAICFQSPTSLICHRDKWLENYILSCEPPSIWFQFLIHTKGEILLILIALFKWFWLYSYLAKAETYAKHRFFYLIWIEIQYSIHLCFHISLCRISTGLSLLDSYHCSLFYHCLFALQVYIAVDLVKKKK